MDLQIVCFKTVQKGFYAIDVGTDQLSHVLLDDKRVISWENTDIRNVTKEMVDNGVDLLAVMYLLFH
mgnify:CR=1 FL=1